MVDQPTFKFIDLFAGIGGFHAALKAFGGECVYAVEIDEKAAKVYEANWGRKPNGARGDDGAVWGDITEDAPDRATAKVKVPEHDVLCAGFPCQPFSKSGAQKGMEETRGTLFFNIASIIEAHHPQVVLLENVRNLYGPRHEHEYDVIIRFLRQEGYEVSNEPSLFSPHLLPPHMGGTPQVRERVFITATFAPHKVLPLLSDDGHVRKEHWDKLPEPVAAMRGAKGTFQRTDDPECKDVWQPGDPTHGWALDRVKVPGSETERTKLSPEEILWIDAWDEFVKLFGPLRGFPYWADAWREVAPRIDRWITPHLPRPKKQETQEGVRYLPLENPADDMLPESITVKSVNAAYPPWKISHMENNLRALVGLGPKVLPPAQGTTIPAYDPDGTEARWHVIARWAYRWGVFTDLFPASRRKLEWQAQDTESLWKTVMHLRPSGIRAKRPTYVPALVAITQTSIVGPWGRRMSPTETALLQGLPEHFAFPGQNDAATYKQMGNGVAVGAVQHVFREHILRDRDLLAPARSDTDVEVDAGQGTIGERLVKAAVETTPKRVMEAMEDHVPAIEVRADLRA